MAFKKRRKLSRKTSKKTYNRGKKSHIKNFNKRPSRGGIRL